MALVNKAVNEITLKLVYYGPGLCGKTTNLERIHGDGKLQNKGKLLSMSTETDRTLFFDFMPMELGTVRGQKIRVQLYTVPGQVFYNATRKLVLRGADGVVFVADSQPSMRESNLESLENLRENLRINRLDPAKIPIIFQLNKRDLPDVDPADHMKAYLGTGDAPVVEASALEGRGIRETLQKAISGILQNIKNNVDISLREEAVEAPPPVEEPQPPAAPPAVAAPSAAAVRERETLSELLEQSQRMIEELQAALDAARRQHARIEARLESSSSPESV